MARISYDDDTFSDLTPEEFQRVKAFSDRMLKEAFAQKGKGYRVQVGTLFGCPIYLDESVPDGEFELEAAAWNRRDAPDDAEAKRIMNLLIEEREAHSREVRTLWDQIYWQRAELTAIRRALNGYDGSNLASLAETLRRRNEALEVQAAERDERRAVGEALIEWAAQPENACACDAYTVASCLFCGALRDYGEAHRDDCLHLRARALRGDDA